MYARNSWLLAAASFRASGLVLHVSGCMQRFGRDDWDNRLSFQPINYFQNSAEFRNKGSVGEPPALADTVCHSRCSHSAPASTRRVRESSPAPTSPALLMPSVPSSAADHRMPSARGSSNPRGLRQSLLSV